MSKEKESKVTGNYKHCFPISVVKSAELGKQHLGTSFVN